MKKLLFSLCCSLLLGCTTQLGSTALSEQAIRRSNEFTNVYFIAQSPDYSCYLVRTLEGHIQVLYVTRTSPVRVLRTKILFNCNSCKWEE